MIYFIYLFIYSFIHLFIHLFIYLFIQDQLRRGTAGCRFSAAYRGFNRNSFTFYAFQKLCAHYIILRFGVFVNDWVILGYTCEKNVFLKGLVKLIEIRNFEGLIKLER